MQGIWSFDHELTHVADVKHATCGAYGFMFKFEACILNGHLETCEGDHFGTRVQVGFVQGCSNKVVVSMAQVRRRLRSEWKRTSNGPSCTTQLLQTPEDTDGVDMLPT